MVLIERPPSHLHILFWNRPHFSYLRLPIPPPQLLLTFVLLPVVNLFSLCILFNMVCLHPLTSENPFMVDLDGYDPSTSACKAEIFPIRLQAHIWWNRVESNHRPKDFQSSALPTELQFHSTYNFTERAVSITRIPHGVTQPL